MKSLKNILSAFAIVALLTTATFAQENSDVNIGAVVLADITLTKNADVSFGNIQDTGSPVLDPQGASTADVGAGATFGKLTIGAANTTQLLIDWDQTTVTLSDGTNSMTFTPDISANSTDDIATSSDVTKNTANAATETSAGGALFVYIGGNLGTLTSQAAGTYTSDSGTAGASGDLNITVNYQ
eukprot:gnl/TRDRNA2_/TRDRNA2_186908_c0_seq1.p2 gnl/TRDRNA2_/TRDRNA2_186908_c0~~gnl/TRDRNA2_/TRDRNA2_186908_c0_seq1.p2  ORF type:complete len:184 (+),score=2.31 gnl/TRDRNA2_/TRDRNA2_186908_c0_seq1:1712-2263(+)